MTYKSRVRNWYPNNPPLYDIAKTYLENAEQGPFFMEKLPERVFPAQAKWMDFLGMRIASPLGVPAGPLLTANWVKLAASLGFDVVTYKTIRSRSHPAHPLPNMIYVDIQGSRALAAAGSPQNIEALAVTNSFGMPSMSPAFLQEDIARANSYLKPGQVMIVSVVGTERPEMNFLQDFVETALLAKDAGAKIIEANFSCPNVAKKEGGLYMSPQSVMEIGRALVKAVHPIPLILKMGIFSSHEQMREVLTAAASCGARGVCGINTVSMAVKDQNGEAALGPSRMTSGICGGPIRMDALKFLEQARKILNREKLDLALLGCGGITKEEHFDQFFSAGAEIAMSATGMMWDPYLALRYHQRKEDAKS
ncbi:MAG: tRNA-dihydrouridine synthase [Chlamydiales bacterium]